MAAIANNLQPHRPHFVVIEGGRCASAQRRRAVYRRRRLLAAAGFVVAGWLAVQAISTVLPVLLESEVSGVGESPRIELSGDRYVARSGDTMWDIARAIEPSGDVRGVIDRLVEANGFDAPQAGQVVRIPAELSARS
ncbi:MAG: LysM peptidoglycan-binding domain-containing protein [Microthrixaceae bacterium]|nr:LysM peptidoglycan-binding domain-containing protein [Microthrixaceae bacterium]